MDKKPQHDEKVVELLALMDPELKFQSTLDRGYNALYLAVEQAKRGVMYNFTMNHRISETYHRGVKAEALKVMHEFKAVTERMEQELKDNGLIP